MYRIITICGAIACSGLLSACADEQSPMAVSRSEAVRVLAEPLAFEHARTRVEAVGTSRAVRSVDIYPVTAGEVVAVNFEPGQMVRSGQVLIELDRREEELAVRLAKLQLEDAERLYDRYQRSANSGAVLPTVLDAARTAAETARLELERAEIALADRSIRAAFDGHVGSTEIDRGDRINPDTMITTLDDRRSLLVSFEVPEAFIGELAVGRQVALSSWNAGALATNGEIVDIGSRVDPRRRAFSARARVSNEDDTLRPGMSFRVAVEVEGELYPVVAETGVQWGASGAFVWSVQDGRAKRVPVEIVQRREGRVLVDADLRRGDIVVVEGIQRMRNGIDVSYEPIGLAVRSGDTAASGTAYRDGVSASGSD